MGVDFKTYLCSEDSHPVSLDADRTEECLNNGLFQKHVDEFIAKYGDLKESSRVLDYSYVKELITDGDFGLLTLLIAVANYGIKDYPDFWQTDALSLYTKYKGKKQFCASSTGKKPYDYTSGGLGIAHWDSGNLDDIYMTVGFDLSADKKHFDTLLPLSGTITKWKHILFEGIDRIAPVFSKGSKMRLFDRGLKQDSKWLKWAHDLLYYKDSNGSPIYQRYLFKLWLHKFWFPTISLLKSKESSNEHTICLQDAVRISRAGNSATSLIRSLVGKNVKDQYVGYYNDTDRYMRQKGFCRRCADIIGWEIK